MVSETREFIPILIFLGLYCTDSLWFYHSRPLGQSNSVAGSSFSRWQQCRRQRWGACWSWQQKICRTIRLFGNCTKDEMTETTVLKNPLKSPVFLLKFEDFFQLTHGKNTPPKRCFKINKKLLVLRFFLPRTGHLHLQRCFGRGLCPEPQRFQVIGHWHRIHGNKLRPYKYHVSCIVMNIFTKDLSLCKCAISVYVWYAIRLHDI